MWITILQMILAIVVGVCALLLIRRDASSQGHGSLDRYFQGKILACITVAAAILIFLTLYQICYWVVGWLA